jgi:glutathione synthase/RimK-type ligase-like ATP-grasp enzyme
MRSHVPSGAEVPSVRRTEPRGRLGVLHTPELSHAPSEQDSIRSFFKQAARRGFLPVALGRGGLALVDTLDALFIRDLTSPRNHTYAFALKAEARGIPVLDDPRSILCCSDKALLHRAFAARELPTPRTVVATAATPAKALVQELGLPLVLKLPESSFSRGVHRASSAREAESRLAALLASSPSVVAQEYLPTPFDWRIGVLAGEPLFACRYHMAPGHWQIINHDSSEAPEGAVEPVALSSAPAEAVALALEASALVGDGLYGVDIKQRGDDFFLIEVNDNPDIHEEFEASRPSDRVWDRLAGWFAAHVQAGRAATAAA